jgi:magnesium chelatase subunit I
VTDIYAALPSITGKLELEYEGELKGADLVGRELVRAAVSRVFDGHFPDTDLRQVVEWFDLGGTLNLGDLDASAAVVGEARKVQGLMESAHRAGIAPDAAAPLLASAIDFVLEGLYAQKRISRTEGRGFHGAEPTRRPEPAAERRMPVLTPEDDDQESGGGGRKKKRYYN